MTKMKAKDKWQHGNNMHHDGTKGMALCAVHTSWHGGSLIKPGWMGVFSACGFYYSLVMVHWWLSSWVWSRGLFGMFLL
jgi:hypothetical protein